MALQIIGAGWGRTGTESLKKALEILDFGKCYHMFELMKDPSRFIYWEQLSNGDTPDYEKLFKDYKSAVDFPVALYYKEFMEQYPDAKVILSVRDPEKWYASASKTILKGIPNVALLFAKFFGIFLPTLRFMPKAKNWMDKILFRETGLFQNKKNDKEFMCQLFHQWNEDVKKYVPAEKLLVFEVKDGWEPLCKFLNVPVPLVDFPKGNETEGFEKKTRKMMMQGK